MVSVTQKITVVTTDKNGVWKTTFAPGQNVRVRAFFAKTGGYPTTFSSVTSPATRGRHPRHGSTSPTRS